MEDHIAKLAIRFEEERRIMSNIKFHIYFNFETSSIDTVSGVEFNILSVHRELASPFLFIPSFDIGKSDTVKSVSIYSIICNDCIEDYNMLYVKKILESLPTTVSHLTLHFSKLYSSFTLTIPNQIEYLSVAYPNCDSHFLDTLFDSLPISLISLSMTRFKLVANPPPLLRFIHFTTKNQSVDDLFLTVPTLEKIVCCGKVFTRPPV